MTQTNYKYYLAGGECMEYSLSPDSCIIDIIDHLAADYFKVRPWRYWNDCAFLRPDIAATLNRQISQQRHYIGVPYPVGQQQLSLETPFGRISIVAQVNLELPIFIGSSEELEDHLFSTLLNKVLT